MEKLQKKACGRALWKQVAYYQQIDKTDFRDALQRIANWPCNSEKEERFRDRAQSILAVLKDGVTYSVKYPRTPWDKCEPKFLTGKEAVEYIESNYAPGYTSEPYVQLIEITSSEKRVVAEYSQGGWLDPLVAAGFL